MKILIIGAGDVGFQLSKRLSAEHDIILVENDPFKVKRASEQLDAFVIEGSGTSIRTLKDASIDVCEIVAAMTNFDEVNLIACQIAKKVGVPTTIARVRNPEFDTEEFPFSLSELGIDLMVHPEKETANAIYRLIRQSTCTDVIEFEDGKIQVLGIRLEANSPVLRIPLKDLGQNFRELSLRIVAINRKEQTIIPKGDDVLVNGDQIFIVCDPNQIGDFLQLIGKANTQINNVMILGGGLIGQFLAKMISDDINTKIIESNQEKSERIADLLPRSLIIHGDGTDIDLLAVEGLMDMDAFIAVTGNDETNIISTLVAHHLQVPRTIALVNKTEYLPITPTIGLDAVVSKQLLTVNAVQRFIRHQQIAAIANIPGLDAHIVELIAAEGSKITRKPLRDIAFPRNAIVGAILHNDEVIIPKGDTIIKPGDKVVIFTTPAAFHKVEKLFY